MGRREMLTDDNDLDAHGLGAEAVDGLAGEDARVVLAEVLDLEPLLAGLVPLPHEVDDLAVLGPLHHRGGEGGDGAHQADVLADRGHLLHRLRLGCGRTWKVEETKL